MEGCIAIVTAVFTASGHLGSAASVTSGYRPALAVSAAISLLGAFIALAVGGRPRAAVLTGAVAPGIDVAVNDVAVKAHAIEFGA